MPFACESLTHSWGHLILCVIRKQGGASTAISMVEFWLKDQWANIIEGWQGTIKGTPLDDEQKFDFHFNLMHPFSSVSLCWSALIDINETLLTYDAFVSSSTM